MLNSPINIKYNVFEAPAGDDLTGIFYIAIPNAIDR